MPVWLFVLLVVLALAIVFVVLWRASRLLVAIIVVVLLMVLFGIGGGVWFGVGHHHAHVSLGVSPGVTTPAVAPETPTVTTTETTPSESSSGGSLGSQNGVMNADQECQSAARQNLAGPSGLVAIVHYAAGPLLSNGDIPVLIKVCRAADSQKEAANFLVAFGVAADNRPAQEYADLTFQGGGAYRLFDGNWFYLPDLAVGQEWTLPATLKVPAQPEGSASLCIWATFGGLGGLPSHDASGNVVMDWQDPQESSAACKAYS